MPKAKERDGVFQRKDRSGWWVSYINASGKRRKEKVVAHTRTQALTALAAIRTREEKDRILGVKTTSEIPTAELLVKYKRHQKTRLRPTTFERLDGILQTLNASLSELAKDITRNAVTDFISRRVEKVAPGTIQKEVAVLKHALKLAVEWDLLHSNAAQGVKLPKIPEGRTRYLSPSELKTALEAAAGMDARTLGTRCLHRDAPRRIAGLALDGRGPCESGTLLARNEERQSASVALE
jgi:hypothetical protein